LSLSPSAVILLEENLVNVDTVSEPLAFSAFCTAYLYPATFILLDLLPVKPATNFIMLLTFYWKKTSYVSIM